MSKREMLVWLSLLPERELLADMSLMDVEILKFWSEKDTQYLSVISDQEQCIVMERKAPRAKDCGTESRDPSLKMCGLNPSLWCNNSNISA